MVRNIDQTIKEAEQIPLSGQDLKNITNGKCNILRYSDLMNYDNIESVLGEWGACILLYQTERSFGHYACLFKSAEDPNNTLIFYDSLGITMDKELKFSTFNQRNMGGRLVPHLTDLIEKSNYKVISNTKKLQKDAFANNTCGRYASMRIVWRALSNKEFNYILLSNHHYNPDYWISILTIPHQQLLEMVVS